MSNLTIISGSKGKDDYDRKLDRIGEQILIQEIWEKYYYKLVKEAGVIVNGGGELTQEELRKICFSGTKYITLKHDIRNSLQALDCLDITEKSAKTDFWEIEVVITLLGGLTPRNLMIAFPITKEFDGEKWCCKDYYYTMEEINKLDLDTPIGKDGILELLWDYQNPMLSELYIESLSAASDLRRMQTGKGLAEEFFEKEGISTYTYNEESGILKDNQTGETSKVKKHGNLKIVK